MRFDLDCLQNDLTAFAFLSFRKNPYCVYIYLLDVPVFRNAIFSIEIPEGNVCL